MKMNFIKINMLIKLKKNFGKFDTLKMIANNINTTLCKSLSTLHYESGFKGYVFSNLVPVDKSIKGYIADEKYWLEIRVLPRIFDEHFQDFAKNIPHNDFNVIQYKYSKVTLPNITTIYNLNPTLIRLNAKKNWLLEDGIEIAIDKINANLRNKYYEFFGTKIPDVCSIGTFEVTNNKPIKVAYKNIHYLTNKFDIHISNTPYAQELACIAVITGLGEGNSYLGLGFCNYK